MLAHQLTQLKKEIDGPRLSRRRSTLGLAVASAVLRSFGDARPGSAHPRREVGEERGPALAGVSCWSSGRSPG